MGNSSGDICYLSRQAIKQRRRSDGEAGTACGNRPIFRVNKHKSSTRQVIPSPVSLSIDHPRIVTVMARTHARTQGVTATITCLEDTKGVAPVGRAIGAWRRVPRQFATRPSDHLSSGRIVHTMTLLLVPRTPLCPEEVGHGYPYQTERFLMRRRLMNLKHLHNRQRLLHLLVCR